MKQVEVFNLFKNAYEKKKFFESILFEAYDQLQLVELVEKVSRFLYCSNHKFENDHCQNCLRFDQQKVLDYHQIGDGFSAINKEELKTVLNQLEQSSMEFNHPKIILIKNAENLKIDAANSLLKFLEEPPINTFLFLLTKDKNQVLPTIKSRSKIISISFETKIVDNNFLIKIFEGKNAKNLLLLNNKLKKLGQNELIELIEQTLPYFLEKKALKLYALSLELIRDLKFDPNTNLAIDRFLIESVKGLEWKS